MTTLNRLVRVVSCHPLFILTLVILLHPFVDSGGCG